MLDRVSKYIPFIIFLVIIITLFRVIVNRAPNPSKEVSPLITEIIIEETPEMNVSKSDQWWLNSGGIATSLENTITTIQGDLADTDKWKVKYDTNNPSETDNGLHPQNIFRLVTRSKYQNVTQEMYFKINQYILSKDTHRSASNGVLFFHHYQDGDNLYYAGIRVDGAAVIKKKIKGNYFTLAYSPIYTEPKYDRSLNPNLIPINKWIGIRTEITNIDPSGVNLKLYGDLEGDGNWVLLTEAIDDGTKYGGVAITKSGYAGIRSDFMDVEFRDYTATVFQEITSP